jgi:hypothetical protein
MKICPECLNPTVKARATNFGDEYDYCRTCKVEVESPPAYTAEDLKIKWMDAYPGYLRWVKGEWI